MIASIETDVASAPDIHKRLISNVCGRMISKSSSYDRNEVVLILQLALIEFNDFNLN